MKKIQTSLLLASLLSSVYASESVILEPLVVESTPIKTNELKSTQAVEVYTADDVKKAHVQNIYDFLNQQTSVTTLPSYGNTFSQKIDFHGYGTSYGNENIVITVDGRKLNNIDSVPQLLSSISPNSIERIEIIKSDGIVSAGDGANAGVINIITKKSNDKEVSFYGGSYGTADASFYVGHNDKKLSVSANGEAQKSDGIRKIDTAGNKDANKLSTGSFRLSYTPTQTLELHMGADFAREDVIYASYLTKAQYEADPTQKSSSSYPSTHQLFDTDSISLGARYDLSDKLTFRADASHEKKKSVYLPSSTSTYDYSSAKSSLEYATDSFEFTVGYAGFYGDRVGSNATTTKNNNAGYVLALAHFGNSSVKAGYRFEQVTYKYDKTTNHLEQSNTLHGSELGYNYLLNAQSSVFASFSHSYQAPDIDKFFGFFGSYNVIFNTFISPMEANNFTVGYNNISAKNKFKLSAYYIDLKNEIYYHKTGTYTGENTNIDRSHKYGFDLYDKFILSDAFDVTLNYNYVEAIIDSEKMGSDDYSGNKLPGVSNHNVKATLGYRPTKHSSFALTQIYRSEAYALNDLSNSFSQKQDAYYSTDLAASYVQETYELFAKINNLFNQKNGLWTQDDAIYPVNFTTTVFAGIKLKF